MNKLYITLTFISAFFAACSSKEPAAKKEEPKLQAAATSNQPAEQVIVITEQQYKAAGITVGAFNNGSVNEVLKVNGTIEAPPENMHTISFPLGGYLKRTSLVHGQYVAKGSVLATMEDAGFIQLQQDYLLSKSKLTFLQSDYERQQELSKTQSSSVRTFQQAKADLENQQITTVALAEKLRLININPETLTGQNLTRTINIYSPVSGYISRVNANPGKYVAPTDVLFEIIDPAKPHISLTVFEGNAASLKIGQKITYTSNQGQTKKGTATIEYIAPSFNETRAIEVHCHMDAASPRLLPGSFITAEINIANQAGKTVPTEAVVSWQNQQYIFVQEDALKFSLLPVTVAGSSNGVTAISSEVPAGKKVVTANAYTLLTMLKNTPEE